MSIKAVLGLLTGEVWDETTIPFGLGLVDAFSGHLHLLHVRPDPGSILPIIGDGLSGAMMDQVLDSLSTAVEQRAKRAANLAGRFGIKSRNNASFEETVGYEGRSLVSAAHFADLILLTRPAADSPTSMAATIDSALFDSARPVLILPPNAAAISDWKNAHIALAWNGSVQAARAAKAVIPLCRPSGRMTILTVGEEAGDVPAERLKPWLQLHGIAAELVQIDPKGRSAGNALLEEVRSHHIHLLAMGAFGHSRLRQTILGGVTTEMLRHSDVPIFCMH